MKNIRNLKIKNIQKNYIVFDKGRELKKFNSFENARNWINEIYLNKNLDDKYFEKNDLECFLNNFLNDLKAISFTRIYTEDNKPKLLKLQKKLAKNNFCSLPKNKNKLYSNSFKSLFKKLEEIKIRNC